MKIEAFPTPIYILHNNNNDEIKSIVEKYYQDNKSNVLLKPEIGSCILFESKLDHEATIVTEGTRHSLVMCFEDEDIKKSIL